MESVAVISPGSRVAQGACVAAPGRSPEGPAPSAPKRETRVPGSQGGGQVEGGRSGVGSPSLVLTDPYRRNPDVFRLVLEAPECLPANTGALLRKSDDVAVSTHGVRICGCGTSAHTFARKKPEEGGKNVHCVPIECGSRLCPWCSKVLSGELADRVGMTLGKFRGCKSPLKHVVLTGQSCSLVDLSGHVDSFRIASTRFVKELHRQHSLRGYILRVEVTVKAGVRPFHVHTHLYCDIDYVPKFELLKTWERVSKTQGIDGRNLWVSALKDPAIAAYEISKYISKPIPSKQRTTAVLEAICKAFWKRRCFASWGTLLVRPPDEGSGEWLRLGSVHFLHELYVRGDYDNCLIPPVTMSCLGQLRKHPQAALIFSAPHMQSLLRDLGIVVASVNDVEGDQAADPWATGAPRAGDPAGPRP